MVTPAIVLVLVVLLAAAVLGLTQVRVSEAARAGAREAARGEDRDAVVEEARRRAGESATVKVTSTPGYTTVTVSIAVRGPVATVVSAPVQASAVARTEGAS